jgi:hypothetical protein
VDIDFKQPYIIILQQLFVNSHHRVLLRNVVKIVGCYLVLYDSPCGLVKILVVKDSGMLFCVVGGKCYVSLGIRLSCNHNFYIVKIPSRCEGTEVLSDCERNQYKNSLCLFPFPFSLLFIYILFILSS